MLMDGKRVGRAAGATTIRRQQLIPRTREALIAVQGRLGVAIPEPWRWTGADTKVGGVFAAFQLGLTGPGEAGDPCWAAAVLLIGNEIVSTRVISSQADAPYDPGFLYLRVGNVLLSALHQLPEHPDMLFVNGTGRDHPRRAGLALHLGAILDIPTVGVTHRPLMARGEWPADVLGASSPLMIGDEEVGHWVRTRPDARPLAVHAGWRTDPTTAVDIVRACLGGLRTPLALRAARQAAEEIHFHEVGLPPRSGAYHPPQDRHGRITIEVGGPGRRRGRIPLARSHRVRLSP